MGSFVSRRECSNWHHQCAWVAKQVVSGVRKQVIYREDCYLIYGVSLGGEFLKVLLTSGEVILIA